MSSPLSSFGSCLESCLESCLGSCLSCLLCASSSSPPRRSRDLGPSCGERGVFTGEGEEGWEGGCEEGFAEDMLGDCEVEGEEPLGTGLEEDTLGEGGCCEDKMEEESVREVAGGERRLASSLEPEHVHQTRV